MDSSRIVPSYLEELYSREQIESRLVGLGATLDDWAKEALVQTGQSLLAVCVLRGGVFFFSDLLLHLKESVEPAFCRASSYSISLNGAPQSNIRIEPYGLVTAGRSVVVIDNICDSGRTLEKLYDQFRQEGAFAVRTVVLVHRERSDSTHAPDLVGFVYQGPEWLAGYGMRDKNRCMNFPSVYRVIGAPPMTT